MIEVERSIVVERPVSMVFDHLDDPRNHVEITPSLTAVRNVRRLDNGGKRADHTYEMAGITLRGELTEVTHVPDERMVFELSGDLSGEIEITVSAVPDGTEVTYAAGYELPGRVLTALAKPFVERYNERELRTTLANLKTRLEAS